MKKILLSVGIVGAVIFILLAFSAQIGLCDTNSLSCINFYDSLSEMFQIFLVFFILSVITVFINKDTIYSWLKFAYWWVPLTMICVYLAPQYGNPFLPIDKPFVSIFMTAIFMIVSLMIIIWKSYKLRGQNRLHSQFAESIAKDSWKVL